MDDSRVGSPERQTHLVHLEVLFAAFVRYACNECLYAAIMFFYIYYYAALSHGNVPSPPASYWLVLCNASLLLVCSGYKYELGVTTDNLFSPSPTFLPPTPVKRILLIFFQRALPGDFKGTVACDPLCFKKV